MLGLDDNVRGRAELLAGSGYVSFALDYFGGGRQPPPILGIDARPVPRPPRLASSPRRRLPPDRRNVHASWCQLVPPLQYQSRFERSTNNWPAWPTGGCEDALDGTS